MEPVLLHFESFLFLQYFSAGILSYQIFWTQVHTVLHTTVLLYFFFQMEPVAYTHLRAHETPEHLVCRLLLEKKNHPTETPVSYTQLRAYATVMNLGGRVMLDI